MTQLLSPRPLSLTNLSVARSEVHFSLSLKMKYKPCELDPLPTSFLTHCLDDLLPHLISFVNDSLHSVLFLSAFKSAIVKHLLNETTLNPEILKNYRPVSNLSFLSKSFEKVVLRQQSDHLLSKTILQGTVKGGRRQGGQRKRWEDNIREWTGLEFDKSQRAVENREKWRKLVAKSSVVPQRPSRLRD